MISPRVWWISTRIPQLLIIEVTSRVDLEDQKKKKCKKIRSRDDGPLYLPLRLLGASLAFGPL